MKKTISILMMMFICITISGQSSYEQYKREREYSQRYQKEQQQQYNKQVNQALLDFTTLTNSYVSLVVQRKSIYYVNEHYPDLQTKRSLLHAQLLSVSGRMNSSQLNSFQNNVNRFNRLYDNFNK